MDQKSYNNRVYTKFTRHVDNANEPVSATHVNDVQAAISNTESSINKIYDTQFMDKVLFSFDNNLYVNSMFGDEVNSKQYIDFSLSSRIKHDEKERSIYVEHASLTGDIVTTPISSSLGEGVPLNDFFLITDEYIPQGASIKYYLITNINEQYPIIANTPKTPCHIFADIMSVRIKAVLTKNAMGESPKLFGLALLFFDPAVEAQYGLVNPDLKRFDEINMGITILVRDRAQEDRLVKVIEPASVVELFYNATGELEKVITTYDNDGIKNTETLNYGDYLNSAGVNERVLLSILSAQTNVQATPNDYSYKFFE